MAFLDTTVGLRPSIPAPAEAMHLSGPSGGTERSAAVREDLPDSPLTRIVAVIRSNERLFERLDKLAIDLNSARRYLTASDCNRRLGESVLQRAKLKYQEVLALLRANRIEAKRLLSHSPEGSTEALIPRFSPRCEQGG